MKGDDSSHPAVAERDPHPWRCLAFGLAVTLGGCQCEKEGQWTTSAAPPTATPTARPDAVTTTRAPIEPTGVGHQDTALSLPEAVGAMAPSAAAKRLPPSQGAVIHLIDRGLEPMAPLRFVALPGAETRVVVSTQTMMAVRDDAHPDEVPVPGVKAQLHVTAAPDGEGSRLTVTIEEVALEAHDEATERVMPEVKKVAAALVGTSHQLFLSPRGLLRAGQGPPRSQDEAQLLEAIWEVWADAFVVAPEVPVGPGALWQSLSRRRRAGAELLRLERVQLGRDDAGHLVLEVGAREIALAQTSRDAALPTELVMTTRSGLALGKRRVTRDAALWPLRLESDLATDLVFDVAPRQGGGASKRTAVQLTQLGRMRTGALDAASPGGQGSGDGR